MKYIEWRDELEYYLGALEKTERDRILAYYSEMYADRRDGGLTEEEAVEQFGAPYDAARKILDGEGVPCGGGDKETHGAQGGGDGGITEETFCSDAPVDAIDIDGTLGNINVKFYDGDRVEVKYPADAMLRYSVVQQGGSIKITHKKVKFKNFSFKKKLIPDMTIYLPRELVCDLMIQLSAGGIWLEGGNYGNITAAIDAGTMTTGDITCSDMRISNDAGKTELGSILCHRLCADADAGKLTARGICGSTADITINAGMADIKHVDCKRANITVSAGKAAIELCGAKEDYDANVITTLSSCNLQNRAAGSERSIAVEARLGTCSVTFTDE